MVIRPLMQIQTCIKGYINWLMVRGRAMRYIQFALVITLGMFIYMAITGIFMKVANFIGELLGIRRFIKFLLGKIT